MGIKHREYTEEERKAFQEINNWSSEDFLILGFPMYLYIECDVCHEPITDLEDACAEYMNDGSILFAHRHTPDRPKDYLPSCTLTLGRLPDSEGWQMANEVLAAIGKIDGRPSFLDRSQTV